MQDPPFLTGLLLRLHVVGKLHMPGQVATQHGHCSSHYHGSAPVTGIAIPCGLHVNAPRCGQVTFAGARL